MNFTPATAVLAVITLWLGFQVITLEKPNANQEGGGSNEMEGYYDPVNKVMCYWIKDSKATPACLYAEWPIEVEPTGTGDEEYSRSKEAASNATYRY